jgi:hypothetical protein
MHENAIDHAESTSTHGYVRFTYYLFLKNYILMFKNVRNYYFSRQMETCRRPKRGEILYSINGTPVFVGGGASGEKDLLRMKEQKQKSTDVPGDIHA